MKNNLDGFTTEQLISELENRADFFGVCYSKADASEIVGDSFSSPQISDPHFSKIKKAWTKWFWRDIAGESINLIKDCE